MNKLLIKLLTISEINDPVDYSEIQFDKILSELNNEFKPTIDEHEVKFTYKIEENIEYHSHAKLVECILRNLLENALLYSSLSERKKPKVQVSVFSKDENINIRVSDNGAGISTDIKKKVWNMFYRGSTKSTGNGLGLYITKRAVGVLKGKISFDTVSGKYTTFNVQLPLITPKASKPKTEAKKQPELQPT